MAPTSRTFDTPCRERNLERKGDSVLGCFLRKQVPGMTNKCHASYRSVQVSP